MGRKRRDRSRCIRHGSVGVRECIGGDCNAGAAGRQLVSIEMFRLVKGAEAPDGQSRYDRDTGGQPNPASLPRECEVSVGPHHARTGI